MRFAHRLYRIVTARDGAACPLNVALLLGPTRDFLATRPFRSRGLMPQDDPAFVATPHSK